MQRINNLPQAMVTPPPEVLPRIEAERARLAALWGVDTPEPLFKSGFAWPAKGPVSGVYGSRRILNGVPKQVHWGVDVAAPNGAPVVAPADGLVLLAEPDFYYTGGTILLDHGHGLISGFLHLSGLDVNVGQRVKQGDAIGRVGATGRATGPHLDWRVRWFDVFVDPELLIERGRRHHPPRVSPDSTFAYGPQPSRHVTTALFPRARASASPRRCHGQACATCFQNRREWLGSRMCINSCTST